MLLLLLLLCLDLGQVGAEGEQRAESVERQRVEHGARQAGQRVEVRRKAGALRQLPLRVWTWTRLGGGGLQGGVEGGGGPGGEDWLV